LCQKKKKKNLTQHVQQNNQTNFQKNITLKLLH